MCRVVNDVICEFVGLPTMWSSEFVVGSPTVKAVGLHYLVCSCLPSGFVIFFNFYLSCMLQ